MKYLKKKKRVFFYYTAGRTEKNAHFGTKPFVMYVAKLIQYEHVHCVIFY